MLGANTFVQSVNLLDEANNIVASSNLADVQRGHQHSLFYKATSSGNQNYKIQVLADFSGTVAVDPENPAQILPHNMQYTYRVYDAGYENIFSNDPTAFTC